MNDVFQAECIKDVWMKGAEHTYKCFKKGEIYSSCNPEWWPNPQTNIALLDSRSEEHFMDNDWFHKHFKKQ